MQRNSQGDRMKYNDANTYFKKRFGCKLYKAAISISATCPNRDGSKGYGGCIFCSGDGSGEFAQSLKLSVKEQINLAIEKVSKKTNSDTRYIAYFQSFTSTYCNLELLKKSLEEASSHELVKAISVATRPDCLDADVLEILRETNLKIPVFVELGFQTSNETTAKWFNRGYENEVYLKAVSDLKAIGINVITHVIFALKGESIDDMLNTVKYVVDAGSDGIKFTCLYVLKGTRLYDEYVSSKLELPSMEEYFDIVEKAISILPPDVVVHRLTGDGPKSLLVAPMWTSNKRQVVNYINKRFG